MGEEASSQLPFFQTTIKTTAIAIIRVALGMMLNYYTPRFAAKAKKFAKWLSLFFLALIVFSLLLKERVNLASYIYQVGWATLTLNILTMALGYGIATIAKLKEDSVKAIAVEVGIQNGTLGLSLVRSQAMRVVLAAAIMLFAN